VEIKKSDQVFEIITDFEGASVLRNLNVIIIPMANPDGLAHGFNGCNAKGINLYWDFREDDKLNTPESYYLWEYIKKIKPSIYIDFHAYTFQQHRKKDCPYMKPLYFYDGNNVKRALALIGERLTKLHDGNYGKGTLEFAPSTLSYKITKHYNTMTLAKYHLHMSDGKDLYMKKAVDIIKIVAETCRECDLISAEAILRRPHGSVKHGIYDLLKRRLVVLCFYSVRPFLKKCVDRR